MTITADSSGKASGHFTIPAGVPAGSKLVEFAGAAGSKAAATFVGRGQITTQELRNVVNVTTNTTTFVENYDPVAETFTLAQAALVSGVDLWFCAKGTSGTTLVQIRETSNGVPTQAVVASMAILTANLLLGQWQRFAWTPVRLEAGQEYAVVVACDDATTAVEVAALGSFDAAAQQWVTAQPYQIGVMLSSSNASTWTAHQDKDLTFRLVAAPITSTRTEIALPSVTMADCDELIVLAAVERPTADCDCTFTLTFPDQSTVTVPEGQRVLLPARFTGTATMKAVLTGSNTATPTLHRDIEVVCGQRKSSATYITRAMQAGANSKVSVYYEANLPGTSSITVEVSPDGQSGWQVVPLVSGSPLGDGWQDTTCRLSPYNGLTAAVRITLNGTAQARPMLRKLRCVITAA